MIIRLNGVTKHSRANAVERLVRVLRVLALSCHWFLSRVSTVMHDIDIAHAHSLCLSVCPSIRPSRSGIVSKWLNILSQFLHCMVAQFFRFYGYQKSLQNLYLAPLQVGCDNFKIFDQYLAIYEIFICKGYKIVP